MIYLIMFFVTIGVAVGAFRFGFFYGYDTCQQMNQESLLDMERRYATGIKEAERAYRQRASELEARAKEIEAALDRLEEANKVTQLER